MCCSRVTNPHEFELDGISFLGTSGQNIDDIYKYSIEENRLALLQRVLEWGHMVPTAPDTLTCYPLSDNDPFILQSAPHVFFVGNQPSYSSQIIKGMSIVLGYLWIHNTWTAYYAYYMPRC